MNFSFTDAPLPVSWLIVVGVALAVLFAWFEIKKPLRFKVLRVGAALLATGSLIIILLKPSTMVSTSDAVMILTPGYNAATADSLIGRTTPKQIVRTPGAAEFRKAENATDADIILTKASSPKLVLGNGLRPSTLELVDSSVFQYFPGNATKGVTSVEVPEEIRVKSKTLIAFQHNFPDPVSATLRGPGGLEDSISFGTTNQKNQLFILPKVSGNFLYELTLTSKSGETTSEKIPVRITPERKLKILFIQKFPTFETQYLKRYLASTHAIVFRYELSRNTFRYDFVNHEELRFSRVDEQTLSKFDLVFLDTDVLSGLSQSEKAALTSSIQQGVGLITVFNGEPTGIKGLQTFLPRLQSSKGDTVRIQFEDKKLTLPTWHAAVAANEGIYPVLKSNNKVISAYHYRGFGKIGFTFLQESFRPFLAGDTTAYSFLWKELIEKTARTQFENFKIQITSLFPYRVDEPMHFTVTGDSPEISYQNKPVALKEDLFLDDVWHGTLWPSTTGWNNITIKNDSTNHPFFVPDSAAWLAADHFNTMIANTKRASAGRVHESKPTRQPISLLPFFILFMISAAFLWLSPKL